MRTLVAVLWVLASGVAHAAPPPDPATAKSKELFTHAESLYALTRFQEALAEYERAFEMKPLPGFLFNIGQCHRQLGNWAKAAYFYRTYLDKQGEAKNRALVESLIVEMDDKAKGPPRADSNPLAPPPGTPPVEPAPAPQPPVVAPPTVAPPVSVVAPHSPRDDVPIYRRPWLWGVVAGGVVVVAILAIGLGVGLSGGLPHGTLSTIDAR